MNPLNNYFVSENHLKRKCLRSLCLQQNVVNKKLKMHCFPSEYIHGVWQRAITDLLIALTQFRSKICTLATYPRKSHTIGDLCTQNYQSHSSTQTSQLYSIHNIIKGTY